MKCVVFDGHRRALAFFDGTEVLLEHLQPLIGGWSWREIDPPDEVPEWRVFNRDGVCVIEAPWLESVVEETSPIRAAGHLAVDLVEACLNGQPDLLCLHCGAAEWGGRLVLFPARSKAGKSTLMARLAAEGVRVLADDVLPTGGEEDEWGWSFGLAPRIRLPLPLDAGSRLENFMQLHAGPGDADARYLLAPAQVAPRHGHRAPIGAIVLLDRSNHPVRAELSAVAPGEGLASLIVQNLAPALAAADLVARLHRIVLRVPCLRLSYSGLDDACAVLQCAFAGWPHHDVLRNTATSVAAATPQMGADAGQEQMDPTRHYRQVEGLTIRRVGGEVFVVNPCTEGIHRLNELGAGIWRLLEQPTSLQSAIEVVAGAYPEQPAAQIGDDLRALFAALSAQRLIRPFP